MLLPRGRLAGGGAVPTSARRESPPLGAAPRVAAGPAGCLALLGATINNTFYLQVLDLWGKMEPCSVELSDRPRRSPCRLVRRGSPRVSSGRRGDQRCSTGLQRLRTGSEVRLWAHSRGAGRREGARGGSRSTQVRGRGREVQGARVRQIPTVWEAGLCAGSALTAGGGEGEPAAAQALGACASCVRSH